MKSDADDSFASNDGTICVDNVVVFGKTGVGKTTTLNALFGFRWATDHAIACTRKPTIGLINHKTCQGLFKALRVVDLPGIGESVAADQEYWPLYVDWVSRADRLLWITQADSRAYKRDELFLTRLRGMFKPTLRFTVGLNKADCLGVDEGCQGFDSIRQQVSEAQAQQVPAKVDDIYALFAAILRDFVPFSRDDIVPYSAGTGWGVKELGRLLFLEKVNHVR